MLVARCVNILQDTSQADNTLQSTTLSFLAYLLVEEGKLLSMAGRGEVQVDYSVRDRLDMPPASGWYFKLVSSDIHSTEVLLP